VFTVAESGEEAALSPLGTDCLQRYHCIPATSRDGWAGDRGGGNRTACGPLFRGLEVRSWVPSLITSMSLRAFTSSMGTAQNSCAGFFFFFCGALV
jgi:hypothetical protein